MSHNSITETTVRQEDVTNNRLDQSSTHSPLEPKQSIEYVLQESKRLIKSGYYKKAFNLVETFKGDGPHIPPLANLKLCRRMVICITKICSRYLTKGDLHRIDHFLKLMNKSYEYLQNWHDLLGNYISKTNPKFNHLQKVLTEIPDFSQDGAELGGLTRMKSKAASNSQSNPNLLNPAENLEKKSSNPFLNKIKLNKTVSKESQPTYLEDFLSFDQESRSLTEQLTGKEINTSFHLDEFIKYYLVTLLNWVNFYKKISKKYDSAYRFLLFAHKVTKTLDSCLDPDLLQLVAKVKLTLGTFYSEFGKYKEALEALESAHNVLQIELSLRINRSREEKNNFYQMEKFIETIRHIILVSLNMSIIYEQKENFSRTLECLRLGVWFAGKFLASDDEILHLINTQYNIANQRYDKYLKELGELERVVSDRITLDNVEDVKEATKNDHVGKMNYYLYNKFNYDKLNASQFIVLASPSADRDLTGRNKSEYFEEKTEFGESKNWSKLRDLKAEGSFARATTLEDIDTNTNVSWKRLSTVGTKSGVREKKKEKVKFGLHAEEFSSLTSRRYQTEESYEQEKEQFELNSEEEKEYIEKLNRNIKNKKRYSPKGNKSNKLDYLDVDTFFDKVVDKKIIEKEDELKLSAPKEFTRIVKDYGFFVKNEKYDSIEFGFARKTLGARARENLGDYTVESKYKPPTFKVAQRNEVKIEAQHIEAKYFTEKRINQKNLNLKTFMQQAKSPLSKSVRFATSPDVRDTRTATLITIDEQPSTNRSAKNSLLNKHTFSSILMKHHENLKLDSVHDVLSERQRNIIKLKAKNKQKTEMAKLSIFNNQSVSHHVQTPLGSASTRARIKTKEISADDISHFAQTTKNTIQLMMETIEKTLDQDENIRKRIEENKTLVQVEKPTEKFLKVPEDLAKSTEKLALKTQTHKKTFNFSQLVKNTHLLNKKTVTIKAP